MPRLLPHLIAITVAALACWGAALWSLERVEEKSLSDISAALGAAGHDWTEVDIDGLKVTLSGTAPDEATRFAALTAAGHVVDASRIRDEMTVASSDPIAPPPFALEILKNDDGLTLIGIIPAATDRDRLFERAGRIAGDAPVTELIETADFPAPQGWQSALDFAFAALADLPRSKLSVTPRRVAVTAVGESPEDRARIEAALRDRAPEGLRLVLDISSPRPVVSPFTLRFLIDDEGARFDACTADSEQSRALIREAARSAGAAGPHDCVLGLGTPSTRWGEAAAAGIRAVAALGGGTVTLSNADVSLLGLEGTERRAFDRVVGDLKAALPEVFSLTAVLPQPPKAEDAPAEAPEFVATRSPEGIVQLRGRLADELSRAAVETFAAARFQGDRIYPATIADPEVPPGWPGRVLAGIEALSLLHNGFALVTEDKVEVTGVTGRADARAEIARVLSSNLEEGAVFRIDVTYSEELDPKAALPTPEECIAMIEEAASARKITFEPSSSNIDSDALATIDAIAEVLRQCPDVPIEIGGHTDSQGREIMNQRLSQARADAVLNAIMARRVLVSNLSAVGYGEERPIADNDTEEGREANRRIEFRLAVPETGADETEDADAALAMPSDDADAREPDEPAEDGADDDGDVSGGTGGDTGDAEGTESVAGDGGDAVDGAGDGQGDAAGDDADAGQAATPLDAGAAEDDPEAAESTPPPPRPEGLGEDDDDIEGAGGQ